jgi:hypothetical protein
MPKPAKAPSPLKLRIVAACVLGGASFAVVTNPYSRIAAAVALADAVIAGVCLWSAYRLDQANGAGRRHEERSEGEKS